MSSIFVEIETILRQKRKHFRRATRVPFTDLDEARTFEAMLNREGYTARIVNRIYFGRTCVYLSYFEMQDALDSLKAHLEASIDTPEPPKIKPRKIPDRENPAA